MTVQGNVTGCEIVTLPPDYQDSPDPTQATPLQRALSRRLSHQASASANMCYGTPVHTPIHGGQPTSVKSVPKYLCDSTSSMNAKLVSDKKRSGRKSSAPTVTAHVDSDLIAEFVVRSPVGETVFRDFGQEGMETALHQSVQPSTAVVNLFSGQSLAMREEYEEEKRRLEQQELIKLEDEVRREEQEEMRRLLEQMQMTQAMSVDTSLVQMSHQDSRLSLNHVSSSTKKKVHRPSADAGIQPQALVFPDAQRTPTEMSEQTDPAEQGEASRSTSTQAEGAEGAALSRAGTRERTTPSKKGGVEKVPKSGGASAIVSPMPWPAPPAAVSPVLEESSTAGEEASPSPSKAGGEAQQAGRTSDEGRGGYKLPKLHKPQADHAPELQPQPQPEVQVEPGPEAAESEEVGMA